MQEKLEQRTRQIIFFISHESFVFSGSSRHQHDCPEQIPREICASKDASQHPYEATHGRARLWGSRAWSDSTWHSGSHLAQQRAALNLSRVSFATRAGHHHGQCPPQPVPTQVPRSGSPEEQLPAQIPDTAINCAPPA